MVAYTNGMTYVVFMEMLFTFIIFPDTFEKENITTSMYVAKGNAWFSDFSNPTVYFWKCQSNEFWISKIPLKNNSFYFLFCQFPEKMVGSLCEFHTEISYFPMVKIFWGGIRGCPRVPSQEKYRLAKVTSPGSECPEWGVTAAPCLGDRLLHPRFFGGNLGGYCLISRT